MKIEEEGDLYPLWIDSERKIVSFQPVDGFERLEFSTHDSMFRFAIEKSLSGFAVQ